MATIEQIVKVKRDLAQRIVGGQKPSADDLALNDACNTLIDRAFQPVDTESEDKMVDAYLAKRSIDTAAAEAIRAFALVHGEIAFAHLVTAALGGWTHDGLAVTPIENTRRNVTGGTVIDIAVHDPRTTITHATVNAARLVRVGGEEWAVERIAGMHARINGVVPATAQGDAFMLHIIRSTDTTRPDGAIASSTVEP